MNRTYAEPKRSDCKYRRYRAPATSDTCETASATPASAVLLFSPDASDRIPAISPWRSMANPSTKGVSTTLSMSARMRDDLNGLHKEADVLVWNLKANLRYLGQLFFSGNDNRGLG